VAAVEGYRAPTDAKILSGTATGHNGPPFDGKVNKEKSALNEA